MFLITSWSLEDCFPRLFLVAEVWIWCLLPGSNPSAFISDLGSLIFIWRQRRAKFPGLKGCPQFSLGQCKAVWGIWVLQTSPPCSTLSLTKIYCTACQGILVPGRLGNLWISWRWLRKGQHLWRRALSWVDSSSCSPALASPMSWCWNGNSTPVSNTWLSIWGLTRLREAELLLMLSILNY